MISPGPGHGKTSGLAIFCAAAMIPGVGSSRQTPSKRSRGGAMHQTLHVGALTVIEAFAERTPYGAVLEDDGEVAYFYGLDTRRGDRSVLDAVFLYSVSALEQHPTEELSINIPLDVEIVWSADEERVALLLNGRPHAAFDFAAKRAFCRSNFPPASGWCPSGHAWDDHAVDFLESDRS